MNTTAAELQDYLYKSIDYLCQLPGQNNSDVYKEIAELSGLSKSLVRDFHGGIRDNLTVKSLDKMVLATKQVLVKAAA